MTYVMSASPYLVLARPHQYTKNLFVLSPLFFSRMLTDRAALGRSLLAFVAFCLIASCVYALNDIADVAYDRVHPSKKKRPLVAGQISTRQALTFAIILAAAAVSLSYSFLNFGVTAMLAAYLCLNILYSYSFKRIAIIDIHCIAVGFVLRIWAGGFAAGVPVSKWLIIMTFLLALFFALSKRWDELLSLSGNADARPSIQGYNRELVRAGMVLMAGVVIVCYILYTVSPEVMEKSGSDKLYYTIFWVILGFFRYLQITFADQRSGSPTELLFMDPYLRLIGIGWLLNYLFILYL